VFAIIKSGGRQVKVGPGSVVEIDRIDGQPGQEVTLDQVLMVARDGGEVLTGSPFVEGAKVVALVEGETRGPKIRVFMKKRRKGSRKTRGHRSTYTRVQVKDILL
jgi:large subunit ribosomal protein L21